MASRREDDMRNKQYKRTSEIIRKNYVRLIEEIAVNSTVLLDYLYQEKVISSEFKEEITMPNLPNNKKVGMLLDHIRKRSWKEYNIFREGLKISEQEHILELLPEVTGQTYWTEDPEEKSEYIDNNLNLDHPHSPQLVKFSPQTNSIELYHGGISGPVINKLLDKIHPIRVLRMVIKSSEIPKSTRVFSSMIGSFRRLKCLCLYDIEIIEEDIAQVGIELAVCLMHLTELHRLDIRGLDLGERIGGVLLSLACLKNLRLLNLCGVPLHGFSLELVEVLGYLQELRWLDISGAGLNPDETDYVVRSLSKNCENIIGLLLMMNSLGEGAAENIAPSIQKCTKLEMLFLSSCGMDDQQDILDITTKLPAGLRALDVGDNYLPDEALNPFIEAVKKLEHLTYLSVSVTELSKRSLQKLTRFAEDHEIKLITKAENDELWEDLIEQALESSAHACPY